MYNQKTTNKPDGQSVSNLSKGIKNGFGLIIAVTLLHFWSACNFSQAKTSEQQQPAAPINVEISGTISHDTHTPGQSGVVAFDRFPATVAEFKEVREKIGGEPHGAIALQIMAFEMYRRDKKIGEECIRLNSVNNTVVSSMGRLNELFGQDTYYARPYQLAAFLKGATPENGYTPTKPYTVEVRVSTNSYQESSIFQTKVLYFEILTKGRKSGVIGVSVLKTFKPDEASQGKYFIIFSSADLYFQAEPISFTSTFNGLD
jgi:hypothetical protein